MEQPVLPLTLNPLRLLVLLSLLAGLPYWVRAQYEPFSLNHEEFLLDVTGRLHQAKVPEADAFANQFAAAWQDGRIRGEDKTPIIRQCNDLVKRRWRIVPEIMGYLQAVLDVRDAGGRIQIAADEFYRVTDSVIANNQLSAAQEYFRLLRQFVANSTFYENSEFKYVFSQREPRLVFRRTNISTDPTEKKYITYPVLMFSNTSISYISDPDTATIIGTKGEVNLVTREFSGNGGTYNWERLGVSMDSVYCRLTDFKLKLDIKNWNADTVEFYYKGFLPRPLKGNLAEFYEKFPNKNYDNARFPRFTSIEGGVKIDNFIPNTQYEGGFSLYGLTKVGTRTKEAPAKLEINHAAEGTRALKLLADKFELNPKELLTDKCQVTVYLSGGDTLFHPEMELYYVVSTQDLTLSIDRQSLLGRQPIISSYHNYFLYFDAIVWNPKSDTLKFSALIDKEHKVFAIESYDFYKYHRFRQFQGVLSFNPLTLIYKYYKEKNKRKPVMYVTPLLKAYKLEKEERAFKNALMDLVANGFLFYDAENEKITLRKYLIQQARAAFGERDYDVVQLISRVGMGNSAELDYNSKVLKVRGVDHFFLSDSQNVDVIPLSKIVYAGKNRDLRYGGLTRAGLVDFFSLGRDHFSFEYNNFKIYCDSIDYMQFIPERHPVAGAVAGQKRLFKALKKLRIEGIRGAIYINRPNNKSGLKPIPEYPVFDCYTTSYKYWNDTTPDNNGVYRRDKLNFRLDPFVLDSLENFDLRGLEFHGEYYSSEIMPVFRDTLKPVRDDTYGIDELLPTDGVPVYDNKGRFYNRVIVDGGAMWGDGSIAYLGTVAHCDSFVFHFDSVYSHTLTDSFTLAKGAFNNTKYPNMTIGKIKYKWYPKRDELVLETDKEPAEMYGGQARFRGKLKITPDGVKGSGLLDIGNVQIESQYFDFNEMDLDVRDGSFTVSDPDIPTKQHFRGEHLSIAYDINKHYAQFQSITTSVQNMSFPGHRWTTDMGVGNFDRESGTLRMQKKASQNKATFTSRNADQAGLNFTADSLVYVQKDQIIDLDGVDSILVADAALFPHKQDVKIEASGNVQTLKDAEVVANTASRYHRLVRASLDIKSKYNYTGTAEYEYPSFGADSQFVTFAQVGVNPEDTTTVATGVIPADAGFFVSNKILFKNNVRLTAANRFLAFDGQVKIQTTNPALKDSWFAFQDSLVNPDSVFVPVQEKFLGDKTVGLHYFPTYRVFYSNFLQPRKNGKADLDLLLASGYLTVDPASLEFNIGPRPKLEQKRFRGSVVSYDDSLRVITSRGLLEFPYHWEDNVPITVRMAGSWRQAQGSNNARTNLSLSLNVGGFPEDGIVELHRKARDVAANNEDIDIANRQWQESMAEFLDLDSKTPDDETTITKLVKGLATITAVKNFDVGENNRSLLILSNLQFILCDSAKVLYHDGPTGMVSIAGRTFNKIVAGKVSYHPGTMRVNRTFRSDTLRVYLAFDSDQFEWTYLEIYENKVRTVSSNPLFNEAIQKYADKNNAKADKEKGDMVYDVVGEGDKDRYLQRFSRYILSGCGRDY